MISFVRYRIRFSSSGEFMWNCGWGSRQGSRSVCCMSQGIVAAGYWSWHEPWCEFPLVVDSWEQRAPRIRRGKENQRGLARTCELGSGLPERLIRSCASCGQSQPARERELSVQTPDSRSFSLRDYHHHEHSWQAHYLQGCCLLGCRPAPQDRGNRSCSSECSRSPH